MTIAASRRTWIAALVTFVTSSLLVGCVSTAAPPAAPSVSATPSASGLLPAAEGKAAYPLTLKSPWGETILTERPERIAIATGANDLDNTLALGVAPVWADDWQASYEWTTAAGSKQIEHRGEVTDTIPVEDIATSEPDLIIAVQTDAGILEDARTALLYPPGSPDGLAQCIRAVMDDPQEARNRALCARNALGARMDPEDMARQTASVYDACLLDRNSD